MIFKNMKKYFIIMLFFIVQQFVANSQTDCENNFSLAWLKLSGHIENDQVNDLVTDANGNIFITGSFMGQLNFWPESLYGLGLKDMFIAKIDTDGNLIWIQTINGINNVYGTGIAVDNQGNVYALGTFKGQVFLGSQSINSNNNSTDIILVKFDSNGNLLWHHSIGGSNDDSSAKLKIDNTNNIIISGTYYNSMTIGNQTLISYEQNYFVAKYSSSGNFIWASDIGSSVYNTAFDVEVAITGEIYVTGEFSGTMSFGSQSIIALGQKDVFLIKLSSSGSFIWAKRMGSNGDNDMAGAVVADKEMNVYVFYKNDSFTNQGRIEKYNSTGTLLQTITFGDQGVIIPGSIILDFSGNIFISGGFRGNTDFGDGIINSSHPSHYDLFVAKYKNNGNFVFVKTAKSNESTFASAISYDYNGSLLIGGYTDQDLWVESNSFNGYGKKEILVYKYENYFAFGEINISSINCDPNNMCIDISVIGGVPPYSYSWSSGHTTEDFCGVPVGTYHVIVTDSDNCYIETDINVPAPYAIPINLPASVTVCPFDTVNLDAGTNYISYIWSTGETTNSINVHIPGTYSVTVMDNSSCTTSAIVQLQKLPNINLLVQDALFFCPLESVSLSVAGFNEYLWSNGQTTQDFSTEIPGIYWLRVYDGQCYYYDTVNLIHYPKPIVNLGDDRYFCVGDSIRIDGPAGFVNYLWHNNSTNNYYWAHETELVVVTAWDSNGCQASDDIMVYALDYPQLELGEDFTICTNSPLDLSPLFVEEGVNYLWSTGETDRSIFIQNSGQYMLTVTNQGGCSASDTINIIIYPQPGFELGPDIHFCDGGSAELIVIGDFETVLWNTGQAGHSIIVTQSGIYVAIAEDSNGCSATDSVYVVEHRLPHLTLGTDTTLCEGIEYKLQPQHQYLYYTWQDGSYLSYFNVTEPGNYSLTVSDEIGCSLSASINISYAPSPVITDIHTGGGRVTVFVQGGTQPYSYSSNGDSWQTSNVFDYLTYGYHTIWVLDKNYCLISREVFLDESLDIPSFFTPNGDGYNDYWVIGGLHMFPSAVVQIYDRFGKKIYEFRSGDLGWNGTYLGNPVPSDTYWYAIRLQEDFKPIVGNVTIKR
jgi:gliding motility-associated-like protein